MDFILKKTSLGGFYCKYIEEKYYPHYFFILCKILSFLRHVIKLVESLVKIIYKKRRRIVYKNKKKY